MATTERARAEQGQTVIEYALVIAFASVVMLGVLAAAANGWITHVTGEITGILTG